MNLVERVKSILVEPKATWPKIESETASPGQLYTEYLMILAAIPAIAGFIGMSIIGMGGMGVHFRVPFFTGLMNMVVGYVMSLVAIYLLSLIVDALAPTFKGEKNPLNALKLVVYATTAAMVGGIFNLIPMLGVLGVLAALYSVYLIYLGLPVLMKCPQEKALAYTAVVILCGIVMGIVIGALTAMMLPSRGMIGMGGIGAAPAGMPGSSGVTLSMPGAEIKIDGNKLEEMAKKMEAAGKQMEAAQQSGDSAAAGKAMGDILGAMTGAGAMQIPVTDLKARLPESLGDLKRESIESQSTQAIGIGGSSARAKYAQGERRLDLAITDLGGLAGIAALAGWANVTSDRETSDKIEKTYKQGQRTFKEEAWKDGSRGELTVLLGNGLMVEATGQQLDLAAVRRIVEGLGLDQLEAIKRPAKS